MKKIPCNAFNKQSLLKDSLFLSAEDREACLVELKDILGPLFKASFATDFFCLVVILRRSLKRSHQKPPKESLQELKSIRNTLDKLYKQLSNQGNVSERLLDLIAFSLAENPNEDVYVALLSSLKDLKSACDMTESILITQKEELLVPSFSQMKLYCFYELAKLLSTYGIVPTKSRGGKLDLCISTLLQYSGVYIRGRFEEQKMPKDNFRQLKKIVDSYETQPPLLK